MNVFDAGVRSDSAAARHSESTADFLNRVRGPFWDAVRQLIEDWFSHLPAGAKGDIRARLRSHDGRAFHAAYWELYLHETLRRGGYSVTLHPEIERTDRRPDFLVTQGESSFYLEARAVSEPDDVVIRENRQNAIYDALNRLESPNFALWIDVNTEGGESLGTRALRKKLTAWLGSLDPDDVARQYEADSTFDTVPSLEWQQADWDLTFRAIPKKPEARGRPGARPVGVYGPGQATIVDDVTPLREALIDKGGAYGQLDRPYVIALRVRRTTGDDYDVMSALFGAEQVQFGTMPDGRRVNALVRVPDGYWNGRRGWRHTHVSAVLIARTVDPWRVIEESPTLWLHPAPERPVAAPPFWRTAALGQSSIVHSDPTTSMAKLLGLPDVWPPGKAFPR